MYILCSSHSTQHGHRYVHQLFAASVPYRSVHCTYHTSLSDWHALIPEPPLLFIFTQKVATNQALELDSQQSATLLLYIPQVSHFITKFRMFHLIPIAAHFVALLVAHIPSSMEGVGRRSPDASCKNAGCPLVWKPANNPSPLFATVSFTVPVLAL